MAAASSLAIALVPTPIGDKAADIRTLRLSPITVLIAQQRVLYDRPLAMLFKQIVQGFDGQCVHRSVLFDCQHFQSPATMKDTIMANADQALSHTFDLSPRGSR
jgi:hypothetical protein